MTMMIKSEKKAQEEAARNHKVASFWVFGELSRARKKANAIRWNGKLLIFLHRSSRNGKNAEKKVKF